ncbi:PhzF family phenazine biosynthesis protein [Vulgatibacter sp.]|uniref:PhzF family phenazine biosynthesis protein n=1 Tax=Vulgatibacter sp. TaxID=1971226 RepID=UPI0035678D02
MSQPIHVVDAFTSAPFRGNPAAVCLLDAPAEAPWMQQVAAEMNLSETAFVHPAGPPGTCGLRWFTPTTEVPLCGHATLAAAHTLWAEGWLPQESPARFETASGLLTAQRHGGKIELDLPALPVEPAPLPAALTAALQDLQPVASGRSGAHWLVQLATAADVRAFRPDHAALRPLLPELLIVTAAGQGDPEPAPDIVSRVFGPAIGIDEDPVTGAAHCILAPWWSERLGKEILLAHQASARGGELEVELRGPRVLLRGSAVTVLRGALTPQAAAG